MRNKFGFLNIYLELWLVLLFAVGTIIFIVFLIWMLVTTHQWLILLVLVPMALGAWFLPRRLSGRIKDYVEDIMAGQTKLFGNVSNIWAGQTSESDQKSYNYYVEVNGIAFMISKQISGWLSEGDEVCVSYWPNTKTVSRVDMVKKATELEKRTAREEAREEAVERWKKRIEQEAEERKKQGR